MTQNVIIKYDYDRTKGEKEIIIGDPPHSDKEKTWNRSGDSYSLFKPTSLRGYERAGASRNRQAKDDGQERQPFNFSHRFSVRGHYRKLNNPEAYGKDRFTGERTQQGRTWVEGHERGGGSKAIVRKTENVLLR